MYLEGRIETTDFKTFFIFFHVVGLDMSRQKRAGLLDQRILLNFLIVWSTNGKIYVDREEPE